MDFAEEWGQTVSQVIRDALTYLLHNPDIYPDIIGQRLGNIEDTRTQAQRDAWERERAKYEEMDLEALVPPPPPVA